MTQTLNRTHQSIGLDFISNRKSLAKELENSQIRWHWKWGLPMIMQNYHDEQKFYNYQKELQIVEIKCFQFQLHKSMNLVIFIMSFGRKLVLQSLWIFEEHFHRVLSKSPIENHKCLNAKIHSYSCAGKWKLHLVIIEHSEL